METRKWLSVFAKLTIVSAILAVIVSVSIPYFMRQIQLSYETAAIEQIRLLHKMQARYHSHFGHYTNTLRELGPPPGGAGLIPKTLADGKKSGYVIELRATPDGYALTAIPEKLGVTGRRSFYSNEDNAIRQNWSAEPADIHSPEI
jgi:hypothetical protein